MAASSFALRQTTRRLPLLPRPHHISTQALSDPNPPTHSESTKSGPKPLTTLLSSIKSEPDPERIFSLLQSSAHLPRFYHSRSLHELALSKLSRLRRPDLILRILDSQRSDPKSPKSEGFLTRLLTFYSSSNLLDQALQLFDQIPHPTNLSFSALLSALLHHKNYDLAIEKFHSIPKLINIEPDLVSYSLYLKALCAKGEVGNAHKVIRSMDGLNPDIVCYNVVLTGYLKNGDENGFEEILKEIEESGLEMDGATYGRRIMRFCGKKESWKGEELLDVMMGKGLQPSLGCFNAIIEGYCKEGDVESAVRVFGRMKGLWRKNGKEGVAPNALPYVVLVESLVEKGEFGLGLKICRECLERKFVPAFEVVKGLVEGLVKSGEVKEARGIVEKVNLAVRGDAADAWKKFESSLAFRGEF